MIAWLARWSRADPDAAATRWVVVDCETSGLDPSRDRLISIGAVGMTGMRIPSDDHFNVLLHQPEASLGSNILIHGIGAEAQAGGEPEPEALKAFANFSGDAPLVAWHAAFDRTFLARAFRSHGIPLQSRWLDLAQLLPVLFPLPAGATRDLDDWLSHFGIPHPGRHDALADAYVTGQLFQIALSEAIRQRFTSVGDLLRATRAGRWTGG